MPGVESLSDNRGSDFIREEVGTGADYFADGTDVLPDESGPTRSSGMILSQQIAPISKA